MKTRIHLLFYALPFVMAFTPTETLLAYDCGAPSMNVTILSLTTVKECEKPIINPTIIDTKIQLLQASEFTDVPVIQCKIEIHRSIYYCAFTHICSLSGSHRMHRRSLIRHMQTPSHYTNNYKQLFTQIALNLTTSRPITLAGKVDTSANCKGEHFSDYYGSWDNVVAFGQIFITLQNYNAAVNLKSN